jgi:hypothetical protein
MNIFVCLLKHKEGRRITRVCFQVEFMFYKWVTYHGSALEAIWLQVYEVEDLAKGCIAKIKFSSKNKKSER